MTDDKRCPGNDNIIRVDGVRLLGPGNLFPVILIKVTPGVEGSISLPSWFGRQKHVLTSILNLGVEKR